jgi:chorismate-pyruvate lyase
LIENQTVGPLRPESPPMSRNVVQSGPIGAALSLTHPLDAFYARRGLSLPPLEPIDGEAMPEPYKSLLVHERDMTSTLEQFHGRRIHLRLISRQITAGDYFREVLLVLDDGNEPVEFGAIHIHLHRFSAEVQALILAEKLPLGRILNEHSIAYVSQPKAFLRLASDRTIDDLLKLRGAHILYGRRNTLNDTAGEPLAEIVEILPPALAQSAT